MNNKVPKYYTSKKVLDVSDILGLINESVRFDSKYNKNENYYFGKHKILERVFDDHTKPNNKFITNLCRYICEVRNGYFSSAPLSISSQDEELSNVISDILDDNDFKDVFAKLDNYSSIYGHAFLCLYLNSHGEITMSAQKPQHWIMVRDNSLEEVPRFAIRHYKWFDDVAHETKMDVELWTETQIIKYVGNNLNLEVVDVQEHYFGSLPVIEFAENDILKGAFEDVIPLLDIYESMLSDVANTISYFSDAYLCLEGMEQTEPGDIMRMKENKVMLIPEGTSAKFLTKEINDSYVENMLKRLQEQMFVVACTPLLSDSSFSSNSSGVAINYKLYSMSKSIDGKENIFYKGFKEMFRMFMNIMAIRGETFTTDRIVIQFTRALPLDMTSLADSVSKLNGVVSRKTLLTQLEFINDVDLEVKQIEKERQDEIDFMKANMDIYGDINEEPTGNNKPDPTER